MPAMTPEQSPPTPPIAPREPLERTHHSDVFVDYYEWLRDKENQKTLDYLEAENAYTEACTAHLEPVRTAIYDEIVARTQQTDTSVPVRHRGWWYFGRTLEGQQYPVQCRCPAEGDDSTPPEVTAAGQLPGEQVLLDANAEAGDSPFFALGAFDVSVDGHLLAYSTDERGDERYTLRVKDLRTGEMLPDEIPGTVHGVAWARTGSHLFYTTVDDAWRPYRVWRHELGTAVAADECVWQEDDEKFSVGVGTSRDDAWLMLGIGSKITSEVRLLAADDPTGQFRPVSPREEGVEYDVEPAGDRLLILHNRGAEDFELAQAPLDATSSQQWTPVVPHQPGRRLTDVAAFAGYVALARRADGLAGVSVLPRTEDGFWPAQDVEFDEPVYTVRLGETADYDSPTVRLVYTSLVTPMSTYDYELATGTLALRKRQPVLGGYDPANYEQHREWATAPDGTKVPISIVCRAGTPRSGDNPFLLYGYGSYEASMDPYFSIPRLSLLDRGFVFAIAHVRGGGEMGRQWYEQGKLTRKKNTFTDFVACERHVADAGWTNPARLAIRGGSAGGLLVGAAVNLAPDAVAAVHAAVPFVDALTTILNPDLPLTVVEWDEWGDPLHDPDVYAYMKSYSPYENVAARPYPAILATTSLNDTRVYYVEPAKWVAQLRHTTTDSTSILLQTEMSAGHGGRSGRYDAWKQEAFELAWICDQLGATKPV